MSSASATEQVHLPDWSSLLHGLATPTLEGPDSNDRLAKRACSMPCCCSAATALAWGNGADAPLNADSSTGEVALH